jgi:hypothetical protein
MGRKEHRIAKRARHIFANLEPTGAARVGLEGGADIGGELLSTIPPASSFARELNRSIPPRLRRLEPRLQGRKTDSARACSLITLVCLMQISSNRLARFSFSRVLGSLGLAGQLLNGVRTLFEVFRPAHDCQLPVAASLRREASPAS